VDIVRSEAHDVRHGRALYSFMDRYPDVSITADFDDRISEAASGYDAIIRIASGEMPKLTLQTLTSSRRMLVAAPSYLAQYGRPSTVDDLAQHKAIHYMERNPDDWSFKRGTELLVARVAPRLRVTSCLAMRDAAIAGLGVASLPTFHSYEGSNRAHSKCSTSGSTQTSPQSRSPITTKGAPRPSWLHSSNT
jgi:DNA-binding transcriptional LysR family regulator